VARLMVCVPSFDRTLRSACAESLGNAIEHAESLGMLEGVVHKYPRGYSIARARNFMAQWALEEGATHLLMVDSDMVLPEDAVSNLLERDVPVCLGFYVRGTSDTETNMVRKGAIDNSNCHSAQELASMAPELVRIKRGGLGCALVKTEVFGTFKRPWFVYHDHADGAGLSEDYDFCRKCEGAGIGVFVDTRVACGHIHERVLEAM